MGSDGNYVLIDHGGGEMSCASHLKRGSARVKKGDRVQAGQVIAQIGLATSKEALPVGTGDVLLPR